MNRYDFKAVGIEIGDRNTVRKHAWLVIQSLIVAVSAVVISYGLHRRFPNFHFDHEDADFIISISMNISLFHSIIAGGLSVEVIRRHAAVTACGANGDKNTFDILKKTRLPGFAKFFTACLSFIIVLFMALYYFHDEWTASLSMFCVTFILSTFWVMITELDDPVSAVWFNNKVPQEWLIDIEVEAQ